MNTEIQQSTDSDARSPQLGAGLERHVWPSGNGHGVVIKTSSDAIFGPNGLGLASTPWMTLLSFLARTGIQEQTGSSSGETDIAACVKGWGQGSCSSRVFNVKLAVDEAQLDHLIAHLEAIAREMGVPNQRITGKVLGSFIATQDLEPYSTIEGIRSVTTLRQRFAARFRGHVQWQGFDTLCGQLDQDGVKHATPELIRDFFDSEIPFFTRITDRRRALKEGSLQPGDKSGVLADVPAHIDLVATDREYKRNKSGLMVVLKIARYMIFPKRSTLGPLLAPD